MNPVLADATATVVAADECDVCLLTTVRAAWQRVNPHLRLPTPGQNAKLGVFGGLNVCTGQWHCTISPRKRTITANRNFKSLVEHEIAVRSCLLGLSPQALLRLTQSHITRIA